MNYGLPYQGSKSSIIKKLIKVFPYCENFYDLFGGGFSVSHGILLHRKGIKNIHFNEIRPGVCDLIKKAINGDFNYSKYRPKWISRDDFFRLKDDDPEIKILWSFGNDGQYYLFSLQIWPYKKSLHQCVVFDIFDDLSRAATGLTKWPDNLNNIKERRLFLRRKIEKFRIKNTIPNALIKLIPLERLQHLERLPQLEHLERLQQLERLERLEQLQQLTFYSDDYRNIPIKDNSIIYCDIPYKNTAKYDSNEFNHKEFFEWASNCSHPVFISEYEVNDNRFTLVDAFLKKGLMGGSKHQKDKIEKVYCNKAFLSSH